MHLTVEITSKGLEVGLMNAAFKFRLEIGILCLS